MAKRIALFNHKGGVSKTTTAFHLGWMLAEKGHRVVLVDADPQCNLTGLVLGFRGPDEFDKFYELEPNRNIRDGLAPAFESQPRKIEAIECVPVGGRERLFLLPGHIRLSEYEVTLGIAQELSASLQPLQNLPGALAYLLDETAAKMAADYILIDLNPSLGAINQNLLMTSDYFIVPTTPDYFSLMAMHSLAHILPRWHVWSAEAQKKPALRDATYPFPQVTPQFLGVVLQKFRPRAGAPTVGFQQWIDEITKYTAKTLVPLLAKIAMTRPANVYAQLNGFTETYALAQIADFNTLIARSQDTRTPVFALSDEQLGHVGVVLEGDQKKRDEFLQIFSQLADRVVTLTK
jgi:cellulose biosynthesis protein BcsQ